VSIALYMDEQVPKPITVGLRQRGVDVLTTQEDKRTGVPDPILLDRAAELGRVIFSQDDDFLGSCSSASGRGDKFCRRYLCSSAERFYWRLCARFRTDR